MDNNINVQPTSNVGVERQENTVLIEDSTVSRREIWAPHYPTLVSEGSPQSTIRELTDRWNLLKTFSWKITHQRNMTLFAFNILKDIINVQQQNWIPFQPYSYARFDTHIKLQINANRFQVGQLQMSMVYHAEAYEGFESQMENIYACSQRPNVVLQIGSADNVILVIPFNSVMSFINLRQSGYDGIENFARVLIKVLSPLYVPLGVHNSVACTVLYRLDNVNFHGLRSIEAQMFMLRYLHAAAEGAVRQFGKDINRDKPTDPSKLVVVPHASSSWAIGKNDVDTANILRLDVRGITPHFGMQSDEMSIKKFIDQWCLFKELTWGQQSDLLLSMPVHPCSASMERQVAPHDVAKQLLPGYVVTSMSYISSCFCYWRGNIEYKLDVVCSAFHTGRLLIAYIPGEKVQPSVNILMQSYHAIIDVVDKASFTFSAPFVCPRPWASVYTKSKFGNIFAMPTGYVYLYALNALTAPDNVVKQVEIMLYARGGSGFELSVPVDSAYGLFSDRYYLTNDATALHLRDPTIYIGSWHYFENSTKCICRYDTLSEHVSQCTNGEINIIYMTDKPLEANRGKTYAFFVIPAHPDFIGYKYLIPFETAMRARMFINSYVNGAQNLDLAEDFVAASVKTVYTADMHFTVVNEKIEAQGDDLEPLNPVVITSMHYFNESFSDLKDFCRRYQFYGNYQIDQKRLRIGKNFLKIPIMPGGLPLIIDNGTDLGTMQNRVRNGIIPLIASCYRFFRGGLRFKIIITGGEDLVIRITHHPEETLGKVEQGIISYAKSSDFVGAGYAAYCQPLRVNQIFEIEVPYYQPYDQISIRRCSRSTMLRNYESLGKLAFSCVTKAKESRDVDIQIFYAFADDSRCNTFMGTFPVIMKSAIPDNTIGVCLQLEKPNSTVFKHFGEFTEGIRKMKKRISIDGDFEILAEPQMDDTIVSAGLGFVNVIGGLTSNVLQRKVQRETKPLQQSAINAMDMVANASSQIAQNTTEIKDEVVGVRQEIKTLLHNSIESGKSKIGDIVNTLQDLAKNFGLTLADKLVDLISHLAHILVNPTVPTMGVAFSSMLIKFGIFKVEAFAFLSDWCTRAYHSIVGPPPEHMSAGVSAVAQTLNESEGIALVSSLFGIFGSYCTAPCKKPATSTLKYFGQLFTSIMCEGSKQANQMFVFLQRNIQLITRIWYWIAGSTNPEQALLAEFVVEHQNLKGWAERSEFLLAAENREKVFSDPSLMKEVYASAIISRSLVVKVCLSSVQDHRNVYIRGLNQRLQKMCDELSKDCRCPATKYEPFVLYFTGKPGCGKSYLMEPTCVELLKSIGYECYSSPTYVRNYGNQYWNSVKAQPICVGDDIGCTTEMLRVQIAELFAMKSTTTFNPPIAELENKKITYNPKIIGLNSNMAFPNSPELCEPSAFWRRRDVLVEVALIQELEEMGISRTNQILQRKNDMEKFGNLDDFLASYGHLRFRFAENPADRQTMYGKWMSYKEFLSTLIVIYKKYDEQERKNYLARLQRLDALFPTNDTTITTEMLKNIIYSFEEFSDLRVDNKEFLCQPDNRQFAEEIEHQSLCEETTFEGTFANKKVVLRPCIQAPQYKGDELCMHNIDPTNYTLLKCVDGKFFLADFNAMSSDFQPTEEGYTESQRSIVAGIPFEICSENCIYHNEEGAQFMVDCFAYFTFGNSIVRGLHQAQIPKIIKDCGFAPFKPKKTAIDFSPMPWQVALYEKIKGGFIKTWNFIKSCLDWLVSIQKTYKMLFIAGAVGAGALALNYQNRLSEESVSSLGQIAAKTIDTYSNAQIFSSGDERVAGSRKINQKNRDYFRQKMKFSTAQGAYEDILGVIANNVGEISFKKKDMGAHRQQFLAICGRSLLITKHFWESFLHNDVPNITLVYGSRKTMISIPKEYCRAECIEASSVAILIIEYAVMPLFRDIRKHLVEFDECENLPTRGNLMRYCNGMIINLETPFDVTQHCHIAGSKEFAPQVVDVVYEYNPTEKGLCGSVLIASFLSKPKICSIHIAGNSTRGYGQPIWKELFAKADMEIVKAQAGSEMIEYDRRTAIKVDGVLSLGGVASELSVRIPEKSRIVPSMMHGIFPVRMEPSILSKSDPRWEHDKTPLYYGLSKHGKEIICFERNILESCLQNFFEKLVSIRPYFQRKLQLSDDEIFTGIPGVYRGLRLNTSEGYPLLLERPNNCHDKRWLFEYGDENGQRKLFNIHNSLRSLMNHNMNLRKEGIVPLSLFVDTLKDCKLPKEKVCKPGATRVFSCCPLELCWQVKKFFGVFQIAYLQSRFKNETAIGISCDSLDWTALVNHLSNGQPDIYLKRCITGDYKAFGDTLQPEVLIGIFDQIEKWFDVQFKYKSDTMKQIRKMLVQEFVFSKRIALNWIYQVICGIPSGFPLTVETNSMVNSIYMRYVWLYLIREMKLPYGMREFDRNVRLITYGDDLIMTVNKGFEWYNFNSIQRVLSLYNISFTSADKSQTIVPDYQDITECSFLKRKFVPHPKRQSFWLGELPISSIEECANWVWQGNDSKGAMMEAGRAVLNAAFGRGPEYYNSVRLKLIMEIGRQCGDKFDSYTWDEMDRLIFEEFKPIPDSIIDKFEDVD